MKHFPQDSILSYLFFSAVFLITSFFVSVKLGINEKVGFVHIHNMPDFLVFSALFFKIKRIPVILDIHDLTPELFKEKWSEKKYRLFKFVLEFVEQLSCRFADHILTVTPECVNLLVSRGTAVKKITLIMNSADEKEFIYNEERFSRNGSDKFKFIYHGTIAKRFGLHYFINALPGIINDFENVEFHLVGSLKNEYSTELLNLVDKLGLKDKVQFLNPVPYSELNGMLKKYEMGVVTYEPTEYMNLAMPTKAAEYALTGLPFIITNLVSVKSIFRNESVCYVDPENSMNIAQSVKKIIGSTQLRIEMSRKAYEDMLKISWCVMRKRYLELINSLWKEKITI